MQNEVGARRWLLWLVLANIAATVLHYVDNICFFSEYPEPSWATPHLIDAFWFVMTPVAFAGYLLMRRGFHRWGSLVLCAYAAMSLLALGHYLYAPIASLPFRINLFILLEAILAVALMAYVSFLGLRSITRRVA